MERASRGDGGRKGGEVSKREDGKTAVNFAGDA